MKPILLFEQWQAVNEIGDASAKPFSWKASTDVKKKMKALFNNVQKIGNNKHLTQTFTYTFKNDEGVEYTVYFNGWMQHQTAINFAGGAVSPLQRYDSSFNLGYNLTSDYKKGIERETNMGEQFRIMSTVIEIAKDFMRNAEDSGYPVKQLIFTGKGDEGGEGGIDTRRGRMYMAFLQKQLKNLGTKTPYTAMPFSDGKTDGITLTWGNWHGSSVIAKSNESIKEAFEYGDQLLTDPDGVQFKDRLKALKLPAEPNTYDEQRFIEMLKDWFNNEQADGALGSVLWELLPLKKKFPKVLDPSKGRNLYEGTTLYRGTMLPLHKVLALKGQWKKYNGVGLYGDAIEMDVKFKWDFKGDKGFTSFTPASETAEEFADSISYEEFKPFRPGYGVTKTLGSGSMGGKIPVILKIKDTHPQALFNPQFTTSISPFLDEWEIFLVGYTATVDGIMIPRWDDYENAAIELGVDLSKHFNLK
jgi:hypothetical protein